MGDPETVRDPWQQHLHQSYRSRAAQTLSAQNLRGNPPQPGLARYVQSGKDVQRDAMEPLLNAEELRKVLRVSRRTLEALIARGEVPPHFRLGRQRRWRQCDVAQWAEERTKAAEHRRADCHSNSSSEGPRGWVTRSTAP